MAKYRLILWYAIILFGLSLNGFCQDESLPRYTGYVNDYAHILSSETIAKLETIATAIEQKTTSQLAIVTLQTTSPFPIETYAVKLFKQWGIGQKGKNNGVLLLIAVQDRALRIEIGYGLEGAIPDALAKNIIENYIVPSFKAGDYDAGVLKGAVSIGKLIAKEYNVGIPELDNVGVSMATPQDKTMLFNFLFLLIIIIISIGLKTGFPLLWLIPPSERMYYRRGGTTFWGSSGSFGGGFGGFGGGFSGGGGASGGW